MLREMDYVYAVYQEKSFSKAAKKLFVSQPALSRMVKKAEDEIGAPIFDRSTLPITVTTVYGLPMLFLNALVDDGLKIKTNDSLDDLGAVTGNVTLTLNGTTKVGYDEDGNPVDGGGNVYGGGEASAVKGSGHTVTVNLGGSTTVLGDVFGGGDQGEVEGSTKVNIMYTEPTP